MGTLKPTRIQRKRSAGWKMPENAVCVDRSTKWGNPFIVNPRVKAGSKSGALYICVPTVEDAVACYREMIEKYQPELKAAAIAELRGKHLACWCKIGQPCHGDVLLEIANRQVQPHPEFKTGTPVGAEFPNCRS